MVKSGTERAEKYALKYDEKAILLRWKAMRDWSIEKFRTTALKQEFTQIIANKLYEDYDLGYGERGCTHDKVEKLFSKYDILTQADIDVLYEDWIREGLPKEALDEAIRLANFMLLHAKENIFVSYETDVFPYPEEQIVPESTDYLLEFEILPLFVEIYTQNYWRQKGLSYGYVSYVCGWIQAMTDKEISLLTVLETEPSMLTDKTVSINCIIDTPFQNDLEYEKVISVSKTVSSGEKKTTSKTNKFKTDKSTSIISDPKATIGINISYETEVV